MVRNELVNLVQQAIHMLHLLVLELEQLLLLSVLLGDVLTPLMPLDFVVHVQTT